tara:strand:+ start:66 stop:755 length:690 start_codon:yes stop_codon:yes gene_type:complete
MAVRIKYRRPKSTDFSKDDLIINVKEGALYYKSEFGVHRIVSEVQEINYGMITGAPTIPPDYGPNPDYTGVYADIGHTHTAPTLTNYFSKSFANDWSNQTTEKLINWTSTTDSTKLREDVLFLMPYSGTLHKICWKQTGVCDDVIINVYQNINDDDATIATATNNSPVFAYHELGVNVGTGDGANFGNMTSIDINFNFNAGDHIAISLQAATDGIDEMFGQILYSQIIT